MDDSKSSLIFKELKNLGVKVSKAKRLKCTHQKQNYTSSKTQKGTFGVNLCDQEWTTVEENYLPKFLVLVTTFLKDHINEIGLFRKAGSISRQRKLKEKINNGGNLEDAGPHDVAAILKQWLRELPNALVPSTLHDIFLKCLQLENADDQASACLLTCLLLPNDRLSTLKHLLQFLAAVTACSEQNKMDLYNVSVVIAPNIFICEVNKSDMALQFVPAMQLLIQNADRIGDMTLQDLQYGSQDFKSADELDSSADFLSTSPKRKGVNEFLSGIKKRRQSLPYKRKADCVTPLDPIKKSKGEKLLNTSPLSKGSLSEDKTKSGFTRRKTFDILRRKNKNKNKKKSPKENATSNFFTPEILDTKRNGEPCNGQPKVTPETAQVTSLVPSLQFHFEKTIALIKKSKSDSQIKSAKKAPSTSSLPESRKRPSPYSLRSKQLTSRTKSKEKQKPIVPMYDVVKDDVFVPKERVAVPMARSVGVPRTPVGSQTLRRHNHSCRKQGTITRQEAFIFKPNNSTSRPDHTTTTMPKKHNNTNLRHSKLHKTMPLHKPAPATKQLKKKNSATNLKQNRLDFQPKNLEIDFKEIDFPLTFDFENLALSPPSDDVIKPEVTKDEDVFEVPVIVTEFVGTPEPCGSSQDLYATPTDEFEPITLRSDKKSLSTNQPRTPGASRIPRLSSTGSISQANNSELRRSSRVRRSAGSNFSPSISGLSDINPRDDSCFKTPGNPDSIQWMSASKFLDAESPRDPGKANNKRESIAMILRNKGHVKDKISMYDTQVRQSMYTSRSCSTPFGKNPPKNKSHSARPSKRDITLSKTSEQNRKQKNKTPRRAPIPPPPKFMMPDAETPPKLANDNTPVKEGQCQIVDDMEQKENVQTPTGLNNVSLLREQVHQLDLQDLKSKILSPVKSKYLRNSASPGVLNRSLQDTTNLRILSPAKSSPGGLTRGLQDTTNQRSKLLSPAKSSPGGFNRGLQDTTNLRSKILSPAKSSPGGFSRGLQDTTNLRSKTTTPVKSLLIKELASPNSINKGLQDTANLRSRILSPAKSSPGVKTRSSRNATPVTDQFCIFEDSILSPLKENLVVLSPVKFHRRQNSRKSKKKRHNSFTTGSVMTREARKNLLRSKSSPGKKSRVYKRNLLEKRCFISAV